MTSNVTIPVLVNGKPVDCISSLDRGLLFGDGVFETLAVTGGEPRFWLRHLQRLAEGCRRLGLPLPDASRLRDEAAALLTGNDACVLKIIMTRGAGGRGYRPPGKAQPTRILQLHPWPELPQECADSGVRVCLCTMRLGSNPQLAGIKHLNRLEQVLARQEWDDPDIREGLMLDGGGCVIEGTMSNLFVVSGENLLTPNLGRCGVAGIMRTVMMELASSLGIAVSVCKLQPVDVEQADEVFLTNSLIGVWPVIGLGERAWSVGRVTRQLQERLSKLETEGTAWQH
ncbi:MAG: aminodeoxychorismate lyase [Gammaproteobacteria bacterium]|nr:MAG: aminodeoxychorismate lyase [Gammaproteobacteria bacterium]